MNTFARHFLVALLLALGWSGCGAQAVEGTYQGSVTGTTRVIGIPFPVNGDITFSLEQSGGNIFAASGNLTVRKQTDNSVTYTAVLSGQYTAGDLHLTFTATDGGSSGTMDGQWDFGCWKDGVWSIAGVAMSGSGTWSACRE